MTAGCNFDVCLTEIIVTYLRFILDIIILLGCRNCIVKTDYISDKIFATHLAHGSIVNFYPLDVAAYMEMVRVPRDLLFIVGLRSISSLSDSPFAISSAKTSEASRPCRNSDSLPWCWPKMLLWIPFFTCHSSARQRDQAAGNETVPRPSAKKTRDPSWTGRGYVKSVP